MSDWLVDRCAAREAGSQPELNDRTIWKVFEGRRRAALLAYCGPFDGLHVVPASVSKRLLVASSTTSARSTRRWARPVGIHACADRIVVR